MIATNIEARRIFQKKTDAVVRPSTQVPYEPQQKFTIQVEREGALHPFAYCTVRSVRSLTEADYKSDKTLFKGEGWSRFMTWQREMFKLYGGVPDRMTRITFNVDRLHTDIVLENDKRNQKSSRMFSA